MYPRYTLLVSLVMPIWVRNRIGLGGVGDRFSKGFVPVTLVNKAHEASNPSWTPNKPYLGCLKPVFAVGSVLHSLPLPVPIRTRDLNLLLPLSGSGSLGPVDWLLSTAS